MDMIDILGGLLGQKSSQSTGKSSRNSPDIFGNVLGGKKSGPKAAPSQSDLERQAEELEDLLNVSNNHHQQRRSAPPTQSAPPPSWSQPTTPPSKPAPSDANDRATVLVRAMINAAKADGQIDPQEQQAILQRFEHNDPQAIQFLREEFQKPLDLAGFAASVPLGMEQQVYSVSLMAINLDSGEEAKYLLQLSQALRLSPETREQIHQRYGAPSIY